MKKLLLAVLLASGAFVAPAYAQNQPQALIVSACGTPPISYVAGTYGILTMDTTGKLCDSATGGGGGGGAITAASGSYAAGAFSAGAGVDGWDLTQGTIADAAASAGGTGTVSAKLREISAQQASILAAINAPPAFPTLALGSTLVSGTTAAMTGTSSTQVVAAVAAKRLYITRIKCNNSSATATLIQIQDGSGGTVLDTLAAAASYGGEQGTSSTPLFWTTAGNGLFAANVTNSSSTICTASGYSG